MNKKKETAPPSPTGSRPVKFAKHAWNFTKALIKDHNFWVRFAGCWYGGVVITEAAVGVLYFHALPLAAAVAGIGACAALTGIGAYGLYSGFKGSWKSLEDICSNVFQSFNPLKNLRLRTANVAHKLDRGRRAKIKNKITGSALYKKIIKTSLMQKALRSRAGKLRHGLSQLQQDIFLAGLTIQGAIFAISASVAETFQHVSALPSISPGSFLTFTMGSILVGAGYIAGTSAFDLYCSARSLTDAFRNRKGAKATSPFQAAPEKSPLANAEITSAFTKTAAPQKARKKIKKAPGAAPKPE